MVAHDETAAQRHARHSEAGLSLARWRAARQWTGMQLVQELRAASRADGSTILDADRVPHRTIVTRWETGTRRPSKDHIEALVALGAPIAGWEDAPERRPQPAPVEVQGAAERIGAMLRRGAPLSEVCEAALRAQCAFLTSGLSPDLTRAWQTFLRTAKQGREADGTSIERHRDFAGLVEDIVGAVQEALGPEAPHGVGRLIADALEQRQAARAVRGKEREAA